MSMHDRAAQFSPFSALTGHDAAIKETARLTDKMIEFDEEQIVILNEKLQIVNEFKHLEEPVKIIYFVKDSRKSGGKYQEKIGIIKQIDEIERKIIFQDKSYIYIDDIVEIESDLINEQFI